MQLRGPVQPSQEQPVEPHRRARPDAQQPLPGQQMTQPVRLRAIEAPRQPHFRLNVAMFRDPGATRSERQLILCIDAKLLGLV